MAQTYTVTYNVKVNTTQATNALNRFVASTNSIVSAGEQLDLFAAKINKLSGTFSKLSKTYKLNFDTKAANTKLDTIIRKLNTINKLSRNSRSILAGGAVSGGGTSTAVTGGGKGTASKAPAASTKKTPVAKPPKAVPITRGNYAYKALGPAMIDSGGIGALDMLKGMGIAYGITGLGTMISNIVKTATEYDNLMQSTKNILSVHDKRPNFYGRFRGMEGTVRNVGMETKFTATEVADATKFLAMAGLDLDAINASIRPVADVALIGDTDLGNTADLMTNIMTGYSIAPERMRRAADIMTMTFTSSNTTLTEIAEAYKYSASLLQAGKVPFEEATAALGILGNAGIKGSQGGTSLRTILANIVNPTKKQRAAWDAIGVKRVDENGNVRDLMDIFADLNAKDLSVDVFYKMFHRTAAQGAVSLANNVDRWKEITEQNYSSFGVSETLANEKKNTIQGLWAQLTSIFTEDGLQAFEGLQSQIREFLNDTINWLKEDDTKEYFAELGNSFMKLMGFIKEFTLALINTYHSFKPMIDLWLQLQLALTKVIIPLRILRSLFNFSMYMYSGIAAINRATTAISAFFGTFRSAGAVGAMKNAVSVWKTGQIPIASTGAYAMSTSTNAGYNYVYPGAPGTGVPNKGGVNWGGMRAGVGGTIGGIAGYYAGSQIGEAGSGLNTAASLGLGLAGVVGGSWLAGGGYATLGTLIASNPVTAAIGAVVAGLGVLGYAIYQSSTAASDNAAKLRELNQTLDPFQINADALAKRWGLFDAYSRIDASGLSDEEKANLRAQANNVYLDNKNSTVDPTDNSTAYMNLATGAAWKVDLERADNTYGKYNWFHQRFTDPKQGFRYYEMNSVPGVNSQWDMYLGDRKIFANQTNQRWNEEEAVKAALILLGAQDGTPLANKIMDTARNDVYSVSSSSLLPGIWNTLWNTYVPSPENSRSFYGMSTEDVSPMTFSELSKSTEFQLGFRYRFEQIQQTFAEWQALITAYDNGTEVSANQIQQFLFSKFGLFFDPQFGVFGSETYNQKIADVFANPQAYHLKSPEAALETMSNEFNNLLDFFNLIDNKYKPLFLSYLNRTPWQSIIPSGSNFKLPEGGYTGGTDGQVTYIDGKKYTWKTPSGPYRADYKTWVDDSGNPYVPSDAKTTTKGSPNNGINFGKTNPVVAPTGGKGGKGGNGGGTGADSSQYKNHYQSQNAAPKQVIVRIGNLMNVQSVDLTNKDNAAVIDNLKGQLTQALVDVVHDFDETWNG